MRILHVIAKPLSRKLDPDDRSVKGTYGVEVSEDLSNPIAAGVALDMFHSNVAVSVLDDFEFHVVDPVMEVVLHQADEYESYSGESHGGDVFQISSNVELPEIRVRHKP